LFSFIAWDWFWFHLSCRWVSPTNAASCRNASPTVSTPPARASAWPSSPLFVVLFGSFSFAIFCNPRIPLFYRDSFPGLRRSLYRSSLYHPFNVEFHGVSENGVLFISYLA
jgi:hypothetical protein